MYEIFSDFGLKLALMAPILRPRMERRRGNLSRKSPEENITRLDGYQNPIF